MLLNQLLQKSLLNPICFVLLLLAIDAAISLGLVSSMVAFMHGYGNGPFEVAYPQGSGFLLAGHPAGLVTNQGHTTNAAGGTALVLVGFGGVIALFLERRSRTKVSKLSQVDILLRQASMLTEEPSTENPHGGLKFGRWFRSSAAF